MAGGLDLFSAQEEIKSHLETNLPYFVDTGNVPDSKSVRQVNGLVEPYVILRFSDSMPSAKDSSFAGPRYDGLYAYVDALCIAGGEDDTLSRRLGSMVNKILLGLSGENFSSIAKNYGGGSFFIGNENSKPIAYVGIVSFRFMTNLADVGN